MKSHGNLDFEATNSIHCLAYNYKGVGDITSSPLYFIKSKNTLMSSADSLIIPDDLITWTEVEFAFTIKRDCSDLNINNAMDFVDCFFIAADITSKNIENRDHHLAFSKSRKGFCPVSQVIDISCICLEKATLETYINGELTQSGCLSEMKLNWRESLVYISEITNLLQGDLILTGTPKGVENNILHSGDSVFHTFNGVKVLEYHVL